MGAGYAVVPGPNFNFQDGSSKIRLTPYTTGGGGGTKRRRVGQDSSNFGLMAHDGDHYEAHFEAQNVNGGTNMGRDVDNKVYIDNGNNDINAYGRFGRDGVPVDGFALTAINAASLSTEAFCLFGSTVTKSKGNMIVWDTEADHNVRVTVEELWVVDSGASHHMSPTLSHFDRLLDQYCDLKVADDRLPLKAQYGVFKENSLHMRLGLYHPNLTCMLVSVFREREKGNEVLFRQSNEIVDHENGIVHTFEFIECLPRVYVGFEGDCSQTSTSVLEELRAPKADMQVALRAAKTSVKEKFLRHVRSAHFHEDCVGTVNCPACLMMKDHGGVGHKVERPEYLRSKKYLEQVNWDFCGQWPVSVFDKRWMLVAVDDKVSWVEAYALKAKSDAASALEEFIKKGPGRMVRNRTDNAPEFRGEGCMWMKVHADHGVVATTSAQYEPQTNGKAERFIRTFSNAVRSVMCGVDNLLWEFAPGYCAHTF